MDHNCKKDGNAHLTGRGKNQSLIRSMVTSDGDAGFNVFPCRGRSCQEIVEASSPILLVMLIAIAETLQVPG